MGSTDWDSYFENEFQAARNAFRFSCQKARVRHIDFVKIEVHVIDLYADRIEEIYWKLWTCGKEDKGSRVLGRVALSRREKKQEICRKMGYGAAAVFKRRQPAFKRVR